MDEPISNDSLKSSDRLKQEVCKNILLINAKKQLQLFGFLTFFIYLCIVNE